MSPTSLAVWAMVAVLSLVVPAVCMVMVAVAIMRAGDWREERRERLRLAREGAARTTLGTQWLRHQESRTITRTKSA